MKTIKIIIFVFSIVLVNYVGGVPTDSRNLFITQSIFFAPYLVEFYPLIKIKSHLRFPIFFIWGAGIFIFVANILGVAGIITILEGRVVFHSDYFPLFPLDLAIGFYLKMTGIVYSCIFMGTITLNYMLAYNKHLVRKKKEKAKGKGKEEVTRKELFENVSAR